MEPKSALQSASGKDQKHLMTHADELQGWAKGSYATGMYPDSRVGAA